MYVKSIFAFLGLPYVGILHDTPGDNGIGDLVDDADILADDDNDDKDDDEDGKDDDKDTDDDDKDEDKDDDKDKKDDNDGDDKDDEDEEDKDKEDKEDDKEEDDDEVDENTDRITHASDLRKAYPDIFKKFPDVKAALYRDQRYTELFGTPDDAESAVKKAGILDQVEQDIYGDGDPTRLLDGVKKGAPESYKKLAYKLLPYLQKNDKELYLEVASLPIKQLLRHAYRAGKGKETNLGKAAIYIHEHFFENQDIEGKVSAEGALEEKAESEESKRLKERLTAIEQRDYEAFSTSVATSYTSKMKNTILAGLDKDDRLTDWMKEKVVEDTLREIKEQLSKDAPYVKRLDSLWKQAKASEFNSDFKSRIINTALARAKSLVPTVRAKLVSKALNKQKGKTDDKDKKDDRQQSRDSRNRDSKDRDNKDRDRNRDRNSNNNRKPQTDLDILRS